MIQEHNIKVSKSARYFTMGKLNRDTNELWVVFHGYGQLGKEFLNDLKAISNENNYLVSIEALNRFYFRGFAGKVGAGWMTKEDRENDIDDYVDYIESVYNSINDKANISTVKLNVLGFSQGTHTAVRWIHRKKIRVNNLVIWSGSLPRDIDYSREINFWKDINIIVVLGEKDKLIDQNAIASEMDFFKRKNIKVQFQNFPGGHIIDEKTLTDLYNSLAD